MQMVYLDKFRTFVDVQRTKHIHYLLTLIESKKNIPTYQIILDYISQKNLDDFQIFTDYNTFLPPFRYIQKSEGTIFPFYARREMQERKRKSLNLVFKLNVLNFDQAFSKNQIWHSTNHGIGFSISHTISFWMWIGMETNKHRRMNICLCLCVYVQGYSAQLNTHL